MGLTAFPRSWYVLTAVPVRFVVRPTHNIFILIRGHSVVDPARSIFIPTQCAGRTILADLYIDAVGEIGTHRSGPVLLVPICTR